MMRGHRGPHGGPRRVPHFHAGREMNLAIPQSKNKQTDERGGRDEEVIEATRRSQAGLTPTCC